MQKKKSHRDSEQQLGCPAPSSELLSDTPSMAPAPGCKRKTLQETDHCVKSKD